MIDIKSIKEKYPKSYMKLSGFGKKYLKKFQEDRVKELQKEHPEYTVPEITDQMGEMAATAIITFNIRHLYDFFSENGIEISLDFMDVVKGKGTDFMYKIHTTPPIVGSHTGRVLTELEAFKRSFQMMEEQL